ncbi:MAG: hypothetical protein OEY56_01065, partial [Cyclobacteriaceae bacterium]|nr:hypothetical protein [Cyclobacteriaceae bacterium]
TTEEKTLGVNFRSSEKIVGFNNWMFGQVSDMVGRYFAEIGPQFQPLIDQVVASYSDVAQLYAPGGHTGGYVSLQFIESDESWQEEAIARTIAAVEQAQLTGFSLRDIAILVHTKAEGKRIANAFMRYKGSELARSDLRYEVVSSEALFLWASYTVKFVISLIRWLHQEEDSISLTEWMYLYQRYIRKNDRTDDTIFQSRKSWTKQVPSGFVSQKDYLKTLPLFELVESLIYHFELNDNPEEYAYLQGFQDAILDYSKNGRNDIASFLTWWESTGRNRAIQVPDENDAIKILTVHKAKGLEYPVVILPFLSWALDHHSSNERILWVNGPDLPPYQQLPVIPLKYGSDLANTYWSDAYWKEKISVFLDKLNLLYVAFTRPVQALYVFSKLPKNGKISDMGQLVFQQAQLHEGWNEAACQLEIGQGAPAPGKSQRAVSEYALTRYECGRWRGKISLQMKGALEGSGEVFDARQWGVELHRDLGRLKRMEDLYLLKDVNLKRELKLIVRHEAIEPFFADIDDVKVEEPILLPNGESRRIDRLVKKNGDWIVVDFKTGVPRGKDHHQVREYMKILQTMGYGKPKGYLVYLDPVEVVKVD